MRAVSMGTVLVIALGVSADAFAVAVTQGLRMRQLQLGLALVIAVTFGVFQALMPLLGYLVGSQVDRWVTEVDDWVAFGLLALVGGKMLREALSGHDDEPPDRRLVLTRRELLGLAVATSIDALAVGISFAFLDVAVGWAVLLIGVCTAVLSFVGVLLGRRVGRRFGGPAEIAGGVILILIGTRVVLDHTGVL